MIPKIIWQTHEKKYQDLPDFQKNIIDTWKSLNPGWDHRYVDGQSRLEYVKKYDKCLFQKYINSHPVAQSDIWRSIVTYEYGGFYADMDSICTSPLNDLIKKIYNGEDMICPEISFQCRKGGVNNSNFGCVKNSEIMKHIINDISNKSSNSYSSHEYWTIFSNAFIENKESICFNSDYYSHSKDYKTRYSN